MLDTLPRGLTQSLLDFCRSISPERPRFVQSLPRQDAVQSMCFVNVAKRVNDRGGETVFGWAIWQLKGVYFEAEHHGIWRKPNGDLLDVSPQYNGYRKILFLPDSTAIYDPQEFRSNRMQAESENPVAERLVAAALRRNEILLPYRKGIVDPTAVALKPMDAVEMRGIDAEIRGCYEQLGYRLSA